ncbi:MAG: SusD/RagB family nutrient-binding outer membrane lipoprotein [Bacteroidales bacterium]|nr:MAG: SusD/RagB family nutrient-binding outer membrane lipoprotein [Bacteroidales bacterium]
MKTKIFSLLIIFVFLGSCTKDWEEMNTDPDRPIDAPSTNVIADVIRAVSATVFGVGDMDEMAGYAGQIAKIQYIDEAKYKFREGTIDNNWLTLYLRANDLKVVIDKESKSGGNKNLLAIAITLRCYIFQVITDWWGDVPYSQSCDPANLSPGYDSQQTIYTDLLAKLKEANSTYDNNTTLNPLGTGANLMFNSVARWKKFTNSLRLRVAIRISKVAPVVARQHIEEILGDPTTYPIMVDNTDNALLNWPGGSWKEPYRANIDAGRDDHGMGEQYVNELIAYADPRLPIYAKPATSDGAYRGYVVGGPNVSINTISRLGARYRDNLTGFSMWMRVAEVKFYIAEAAFNGWSTNGVTAQAAYESGVNLSCLEAGVAPAAITTYMAQPIVAWDGSVNKIYMQKWFCLMKMGAEAWAETRRTDVPVLPMAIQSVFPGHNRPPFRYKYPQSEENLNTDNALAAKAGISDNFWGKKMWWDTRTGVN